MKARYLVKYSKGNGVKFISHLDLMRAIQRAVRRAEIPVSYSQGFNPHAEISFATPLPVGTWSTGEYLDIKLDEKLEDKVFVEKANVSLPEHIRFLWAREIPDKFPSLMSIVGASSYEISLSGAKNGAMDENTLNEFLQKPGIQVIKKGKNGEKVVDIKPMIYSLKLKGSREDQITFDAMIESGSRSNLNPELIVDAMKSMVHGMDGAEIRDIKKIETYVRRGEKLITPLELLESGRVE